MPASVDRGRLDIPPGRLEKWTPRRAVARVRSEKARSLGWERVPGAMGRAGKGLVPYTATDPRVEPADCTHGQIKDIGGAPGPRSRCLDCGGLIDTASRSLVDREAPDVVADDTLDALRQEWGAVFWGAP